MTLSESLMDGTQVDYDTGGGGWNTLLNGVLNLGNTALSNLTKPTAAKPASLGLSSSTLWLIGGAVVALILLVVLFRK